jgi:Ca-activated chloride channel family protein
VSTVKRVILALLATAAIAALAALYPWLARRDAWLDASVQHPWLLLGLIAVPVVWIWGIFAQDARRPRLRLGTISPLKAGPRGLRSRLRDLPGVVRAVAIAFLVLAMVRPVSTLRDQRSDDKGIDIVLAMDLSGSMRALLDAPATDLPGSPKLPRTKRPTRLDTAKIVIQDFIGRRKTDRIGVVVFGKAAYVLSPPTLDYHLLAQLVSKMSLNVIDGNATAIGDALGASVARLRRSDAISKVVILLTDGDSNAGSISPEYAAHLAATTGVKVYTIQIGNDDEVDVEEGRDLFGQPRYVRRSFPVNPELLRSIAQQTGGEMYVATDAKALSDSMHDVLDKLEKTRFEASIASYEDLFPLLLIPGAALVGIDALLRAWLLRRFP